MLRSLWIVLVAASAGTPGPSVAEAAQDRTPTGRRIYQMHCAACHGAAAQGQRGWQRPGPTGDLPAPPHDRRGHTWKHSDGMLYRMVRDGWRDPFNKSSGLTMPAFGSVLSPAEIREVVEYLKTHWTTRQKNFQRQESAREPYPPEARASSDSPAKLPKE